MTKLDDILRNHVYVLTQLILHPSPQEGNEVYTEPTIRDIKDLFKEIVGENELTPMNTPNALLSISENRKVFNNELKAELRKKIEEL